MKKIDRRDLLHAGIAFAVPFGGLTLLGSQAAAKSNNVASPKVVEAEDNTIKHKEEGENMHIQFLEVVTTEVDKLCKQYAAIHDITFGEPVANLGNARIAKLKGGGQIGIRGPLRETETPVVRPYMLVENLEKAVTAAEEAGAEIAIPSMAIPGHGTIAIVIQGGIECGMWQQ